MVADDLDGVLVCADSTVTAETPELALDGAGDGGAGCGSFLEGEVGDIVNNADGELALHLVLLQLVVNSEHGGGRSVLGAKAVAAADDLNIGSAGVGESGHNIEVERLTLCAGLLGAVEDCNLLGGCGDGGNELVRAERAK